MIHCLLFNTGGSSEKRKQKHLIVSRHGITTETYHQTNLIRLGQYCYSHYFLSKTGFNSCKMECFIYNGGCGVHLSRCVKEKQAWVIDKWFQFTISYYTIPLETCKKAIN